MRAVSSPDRPLTVIPLQQVESLLSPAAPGHVREQTDRLVPPACGFFPGTTWR